MKFLGPIPYVNIDDNCTKFGQDTFSAIHKYCPFRGFKDECLFNGAPPLSKLMGGINKDIMVFNTCRIQNRTVII